MTFLWDVCDTCTRRRPTRTCWLYPERSVCPYCCAACPERAQCPRPVWLTELVAPRPAAPARQERRRAEAAKALEELLKRLEGG